MVPVLTLLSAVPSVLLMLLLRNVVLGAALGFVLVNVLIVVTGQPTDQVALCYFLTLMVSATYILAHRRHIRDSIAQRHWRRLLFELSG